MNRLALVAALLATALAGSAVARSDAVRVVPGAAISVVANGDPRARKSGTWHDKSAIVTVTIPALHAATISGSGFLRTTAVAAPAFVGRISGSGSIVVAGGPRCTVRQSGAAVVRCG